MTSPHCNHNADNPPHESHGMGLGSTAKKIQALADTAEKMYRRINALRKEVDSTKQTVEGTNKRVEAMEVEMAEQRAILEAIGEELGVDIDAAVANAEIPTQAEASGEEATIPVTEDGESSEAAAGDDADSDTSGDNTQ